MITELRELKDIQKQIQQQSLALYELKTKRNEIRSLSLSKTKEYNREKARIWREKNHERMKEIRRESARRTRLAYYVERGEMPPRSRKLETQIMRQEMLKKVGTTTSIKEAQFRVRPKDFYDVQTPVELCTNCARKYLVPLGCLFCK